MAEPPLQKEALERLEKARARKADVTLDLMEGYFFTNPRRARSVQSQYKAMDRPERDAAELQTTLGTECSGDFAGLVVNTFMPANFPWCKRGQGPIPEEQWDNVKEAVAAADDTILATIRSSNFDAEAFKAFDPDLSIGTVAMWIDEDAIWKLPRCRAIPIRKLEIDLGPDNEIGPRFYVDQVPGRDVAAVVGKAVAAKLTNEIKDKIDRDQKGVIECVWGFWRDWDIEGTEEWIYTVLVDKTLVFDDRLQGEGSLPLVITPWAPNPDSPWGDGCALRAIPYLRVLDSISGATVDQTDFHVQPPFTYPHDGVINFENGIEPGKAYPHAAGIVKDEFVDLSFGKGDLKAGYFTIEYLEKAIKRLWLVDRPEQIGKTPPTATQWLNDLVDMQKRMGLVGQKFWRDGPRAYFTRYRYLLERKGQVQKFGDLPLEPYNPALKGQEYQEVQLAGQLMSMMGAYGGVQGQALLDANATFKNIKEKLGDKIVVFNDPAIMAKLLQQLAPQAQIRTNPQVTQ